MEATPAVLKASWLPGKDIWKCAMQQTLVHMVRLRNGKFECRPQKGQEITSHNAWTYKHKNQFIFLVLLQAPHMKGLYTILSSAGTYVRTSGGRDLLLKVEALVARNCTGETEAGALPSENISTDKGLSNAAN